MGARRDDITSSQRAQIAIAVLSPQRPWGSITKWASEYEVSRQTVYEIAAAGAQILEQGLEPGQHGPQQQEKVIRVDRNRLVRGSVVLTKRGVSQRGIEECLAELLDSRVSPAWINQELSKVEQAAARVNAQWQPEVGETLSGDEIYSNGQPNLLLVGNESLYIYALSRQDKCDGETWGCLLLDGPDSPLFASDGGKGLAAGVALAGIALHQLDWDHLLRPLWGQAKRLERAAYAALKEVEKRARKFDQAHTSKRLAQHLDKWEQLSVEAEKKMQRYDAFYPLARQVDEEFALIDLETGTLRDVSVGVERLRHLGKQLQTWKGRIYKNLSDHVANWATGLFSYQPLLAQALAPLSARWGQAAIQALSRLWQIEADEKRHSQPLIERHSRQNLWEASLDQALALLGEEQLWPAWHALSVLLDRSWRGSMLAECVNSLLRPLLDARKHTDQGCLELSRFLHNVHFFARGKRANHSPAQLVGLDVPDDPLTLLGLAPKTTPLLEPASQQVSFVDQAFVTTCTRLPLPLEEPPAVCLPLPFDVDLDVAHHLLVESL